jgi:hypothetical protein
MSGNPNLDTVLSFLAGKGLTKAQAAGVAGNFQVESGAYLNPKAYNAGEGAIGIAQWENGRRTALQAYARATGGSETDLNTQLGYLWQELSGPEHGALVALQQTTSASAAAAAFDSKFERSSGSSRAQRVKNAEAIAANTSGAINWTGTAGAAVAGAAGAVVDAVSNPLDAITNLFGGWQDGVMTIGLKVLAGTAAAALVIAGAWAAVHDEGGTPA